MTGGGAWSHQCEQDVASTPIILEKKNKMKYKPKNGADEGGLVPPLLALAVTVDRQLCSLKMQMLTVERQPAMASQIGRQVESQVDGPGYVRIHACIRVRAVETKDSSNNLQK